jgi:hypothetical protein
MALLDIGLNRNLCDHLRCLGTLSIQNLISSSLTIFMLAITYPMILLGRCALSESDERHLELGIASLLASISLI